MMTNMMVMEMVELVMVMVVMLMMTMVSTITVVFSGVRDELDQLTVTAVWVKSLVYCSYVFLVYTVKFFYLW